MRFIQPNRARRCVVFAAAVLVASFGALAPAMADDVKIVTGEVSPEELAAMLFVERPRTRSLEFSEPPRVAFMVQFGFDSAAILPESRPQLDALGNMLKIDQVADKSLRIEGHTDSTGAKDFNLELSHARAESAATYLQTFGIAEERFVLRAFGEDRPVAPNSSEDLRALNRRVEITLVAGASRQ